MLLSEGQMSDHKGARLVLDALPPARTMIADKGYDSKPFREALQARGIEPCIPSSRSRKVPYPYDTALYKQRHKVENLFAKLKDWRRITTCHDRRARILFHYLYRSRLHNLALINESSGNFWLLPSGLEDGSHFWPSKLKEGSSHETLCRKAGRSPRRKCSRHDRTWLWTAAQCGRPRTPIQPSDAADRRG